MVKILIVILVALTLGAQGIEDRVFTEQVQPFLEKHCFSCHGEKKQKGKLRLDNLSTDFSDLEIAEEWQFILDELNGATMPPED